jgi:hypothetical protein
MGEKTPTAAREYLKFQNADICQVDSYETK